ncbi:MAG: ABC transporter permease [Candidatus Schekmanbacteria bacterium]|nr:MAG: ABC transporter permease [Candidatus Schekmanbacteria bacterium]
MTIFHIIIKELKLLVRDKTSLILMTAVPIVVISVAGLALSGLYGRAGTNVKIYLPIADNDKREFSAILPEMLKKSGFFNVEIVSEEDAYRLVKDDNKAAAAIIIPEGFSRNCISAGTPSIKLITDPAKALEISTIRSALKEFELRLSLAIGKLKTMRSSTLPLLLSLNPSLIEKKVRNLIEQGAKTSISIEEVNLTEIKKNLSSFDQNVPGFSIMFAMFGMLYGFSESIFKERDEDNTMRRFLSSPAGFSSLLYGKLISKIITGFIQMMILFGFGYFVFDMSLGNSILGLSIAILGISFSSASIGLLVSSVSNTKEQARSLGTLTILTLAGLGGCWWPLFIEPAWMQKLSLLAMPAWGMNCFYNFMLRGKEISDTLYYLIGLYSYGIIALIVGMIIFSNWDERRLL